MESNPSSSSIAATTPTSSSVFSFSALSKLELISGSPSTLPHRPSSSTIAKAPDLGSFISLRSAFTATQALANHLPYELVAQILSSGAWTRWQQLVALTHICQHWRGVALGTPQLWVDAAQSVFAAPCRWYGGGLRWPKCLPIFFARSEPLPLKINFSHHTHLIEGLRRGAVLQPHISRVAHLCVYAGSADALKTVLSLVHSHFRNLESLGFPQVGNFSGIPFAIKKLPVWDDPDFPRLHTLVISGQYFGRAIAVASLKTLVLYDGPRRHDVFLDALERCAPALESLTLRDWSHPEAPSSATTTVHLPRLRRLEVTLPSKTVTTPPTLLFAALSLPPDVAVDLDWHSNRGSTLELLPKHLSGLNAPPFFDSMCLHLFTPSSRPPVASLHGYVGTTEWFCVREEMTFDSADKDQGLVGRFPDGHRWPASVTQVAVDLDTEGPAYALEHHLHTFVAGFPGLRRLDLLGRSIGRVKLGMVDAFLDLPPLSESSDGERTLGYVCEASECASTTMVDALRAQLDALEARLARHQGLRLHRLEVCVAYSSRSPHPPPRWGCPTVGGVEPITVLTAYLSSMYVPRFKKLVDEVVFVRGAQARKPGFRVITRAERRHLVPGIKPHLVPRFGGRGRGSSDGRKGR